MLELKEENSEKVGKCQNCKKTCKNVCCACKAWYCSDWCLRLDWLRHKYFCNPRTIHVDKYQESIKYIQEVDNNVNQRKGIEGSSSPETDNAKIEMSQEEMTTEKRMKKGENERTRKTSRSIASNDKATCIKCFTTFESRSKHDSHYCYFPGTYVCTTCWTEFENARQLYDHLCQDTIECMGCLKRFREEMLAMKPHIHFSSQKEKILESKAIKHKCFRKTNSKNEKNLYKCLICSYVEMNESFACPNCSTKLSTDAGLKCHIFKCHSFKYICAECSIEVESENHLQMHLCSYDEGLKHFTCPKCRIKFDTEENYKQYMSSIHGPKHSDYVSSQMSSIRVHELIRHGKVKAHECDICHKKFALRHTLRNHKLTHQTFSKTVSKKSDYASYRKDRHNANKQNRDEPKHFCDKCPAKFIRLDNLKRHIMITHYGLRPFKCNHCNYTASSKPYLRNHKQRKHAEGKEDINVFFAPVAITHASKKCILSNI